MDLKSLYGPYVVGFQMTPTIRKPEKMLDLVYTVLYINANPVIRVLPVLG